MASLHRYTSPFGFSISENRLWSEARCAPRRAASWRVEDSFRWLALQLREGSSSIYAPFECRVHESQVIPSRKEARRRRSSAPEPNRTVRIQVPIRDEHAMPYWHPRRNRLAKFCIQRQLSGFCPSIQSRREFLRSRSSVRKGQFHNGIGNVTSLRRHQLSGSESWESGDREIRSSGDLKTKSGHLQFLPNDTIVEVADSFRKGT